MTACRLHSEPTFHGRVSRCGWEGWRMANLLKGQGGHKEDTKTYSPGGNQWGLNFGLFLRISKSSSRSNNWLHPRSTRPSSDLLLIPDLLNTSSDHKCFLTMYFQTVTNGEVLDLRTISRYLKPKSHRLGRITGITIMLDDRGGMDKVGPRSLIPQLPLT